MPAFNASEIFLDVQASLPAGTNSTVQLETVAQYLVTNFSQLPPANFRTHLYAMSGLLAL